MTHRGHRATTRLHCGLARHDGAGRTYSRGVSTPRNVPTRRVQVPRSVEPDPGVPAAAALRDGGWWLGRSARVLGLVIALLALGLGGITLLGVISSHNENEQEPCRTGSENGAESDARCGSYCQAAYKY